MARPKTLAQSDVSVGADSSPDMLWHFHSIHIFAPLLAIFLESFLDFSSHCCKSKRSHHSQLLCNIHFYRCVLLLYHPYGSMLLFLALLLIPGVVLAQIPDALHLRADLLVL